MLHVFGHKNPDTDAILSSILYARYVELTGYKAKTVRLGEINNETAYCLSLLGRVVPELVTTLPAGTEVVLTDHNEKTQSIDNIDELNVVGVIDHHKFNLSTNEPIKIIVRPFASTCSVIYWLRENEHLEITQDVARAMMLGIISDTLYFRSPTTTPYDKFIFSELEKIANFEDPEQISLEMFAAKSDLGDISVRNLITLDYKVFEANGKKFAGGSIETTNPAYALGRKEEIVNDLIALKQEAKLDFVFLSVVDILNEINTTIVATKEDELVIKAVFGVDTVDHIANLGSRISRKKQLAGPLTDYFSA